MFYTNENILSRQTRRIEFLETANTKTNNEISEIKRSAKDGQNDVKEIRQNIQENNKESKLRLNRIDVRLDNLDSNVQENSNSIESTLSSKTTTRAYNPTVPSIPVGVTRSINILEEKYAHMQKNTIQNYAHFMNVTSSIKEKLVQITKHQQEQKEKAKDEDEEHLNIIPYEKSYVTLQDLNNRFGIVDELKTRVSLNEIDISDITEKFTKKFTVSDEKMKILGSLEGRTSDLEEKSTKMNEVISNNTISLSSIYRVCLDDMV